MEDILFDHQALMLLRDRHLDPGSRFIRTATSEVHWVERGDADTALSVVILSGQWLGATALLPLASALCPESRVLVVDLPGHGLAAPFAGPDYSAKAYADLITEMIGALDLRRIVLVGHSHSGMPAALVAASMPERISGLVLATASGMPRDRTLPAGAPAPVDPNAQWYAQRLAGLMLRDHDPAMRRALAERTWAEHAIAGRLAETVARARAFDPALFARVLPDVRVPSLVLWSSDSIYLPTVTAGQVAALLSDCRGCHVIPATGHLLLADAPDDVAKHVNQFMETLR